MLRRIKSFSTSREQREVLLLVLGGLSLAASFFANGRWRPDPAWLALIASVCIGEIFAAGEVAFIMQIGALLEERTVAKARAGIERLVRLTPPHGPPRDCRQRGDH